MSWLEKIMPTKVATDAADKHSVPEGVWSKCGACGSVLYRAELERTFEVCPKCGGHRPMAARRRLDLLLDAEGRLEIAAGLEASDPLKFKDLKKYRDRLQAAEKSSGEKEAMIVMQGAIKGLGVVAASFEFNYMAGSMGSVVGEKFVRAVDAAIDNSLPLICFSASGGARMQEALYSLLQMAKTSAALARLSAARLPYISVMTDPTTGGVSASLAMLGDINVAEPGALIGFAGPRVIEQTVRQKLPEGFQTAEFLLEHGAIDLICDRREMRDTLHNILAILQHHGASH